jgi:hypothetical protein
MPHEPGPAQSVRASGWTIAFLSVFVAGVPLLTADQGIAVWHNLAVGFLLAIFALADLGATRRGGPGGMYATAPALAQVVLAVWLIVSSLVLGALATRMTNALVGILVLALAIAEVRAAKGTGPPGTRGAA